VVPTFRARPFYCLPLREALDQLREDDLQRVITPEGSEGVSIPLWRSYWFDIRHDFEHGGQIFQIKNEYLRR